MEVYCEGVGVVISDVGMANYVDLRIYRPSSTCFTMCNS